MQRRTERWTKTDRGGREEMDKQGQFFGVFFFCQMILRKCTKPGLRSEDEEMTARAS